MSTLTAKDFALKGIKTFRGVENDQLEATLYCQGKAACSVFDDGWGGGNMIEWKSPEVEQRVMEFVKAQPPVVSDLIDDGNTGKPFTYDYSLDSLIDDLFNAHQRAKDEASFARKAKKTCLFRLKGDEADTWRTCGKNLITDADHYRARTAMVNKYGDQIEVFWRDHA